MRPVDDAEILNEYEVLSREVGFFCKKSVSIPSLSVAKNLFRLVKFTNSIEAAEAVMKVTRFSPSPKTDEEKEAKKICCEALHLARKKLTGEE
jgi:hypothetical protein